MGSHSVSLSLSKERRWAHTPPSLSPRLLRGGGDRTLYLSLSLRRGDGLTLPHLSLPGSHSP